MTTFVGHLFYEFSELLLGRHTSSLMHTQAQLLDFIVFERIHNATPKLIYLTSNVLGI